MSEVDPKLVNQKLIDVFAEMEDTQKYGNSEEPPKEAPFADYLRLRMREDGLFHRIFQITEPKDANEFDR
jgi:hypothetical protein